MTAMAFEVGVDTLRLVGAEAGEAIKARRVALGMTRTALANKAGVDRSRVARAESGQTMHDATLHAIEKALDEREAELADRPAQRQGRSTSTIELASGDRVTFAGDSTGDVIDLVEEFLARQRRRGTSE